METEPARAGLYWRRGPHVTPAVMSIEGDQVSLVTDEGELFRALVPQVSAVFSRHGTLTVTIGGTTWDLVTGAFAGALAPRFSPRLIGMLTGDASQEAVALFQQGATTMVTSNAIQNTAVLLGSTLGRGFGIVGGAIGTVTMFRAQQTSFALSRAWTETLRARGVAVEMRGSTYGRSQLLIAAIVIPAFLVVVAIGVIVSVVLS